MKSVRVQSFSGPFLLGLGLNSERYGVRMQENTEQKYSEQGHFSHSGSYSIF